VVIPGTRVAAAAGDGQLTNRRINDASLIYAPCSRQAGRPGGSTTVHAGRPLEVTAGSLSKPIDRRTDRVTGTDW